MERSSLGFWVLGLEGVRSRMPAKVLSDIIHVLWVQAAGSRSSAGTLKIANLFCLGLKNLYCTVLARAYAKIKKLYSSS